MLTVPNTATWEAFFNSVTNLSNCNVKVYDYNNNFLIDKVNISNYTITSRNKYVCDQTPTDEVTIEVIDWNALSSSVQTKLTTLDSVLLIRYTVNGIETTNYKVLIVYDFKLSRDGNIMTLQLRSPFSIASGFAQLRVAQGFGGSINTRNYASVDCTATGSSATIYISLRNQGGVIIKRPYPAHDIRYGSITDFVSSKVFDVTALDTTIKSLNFFDYDITTDYRNRSKQIEIVSTKLETFGTLLDQVELSRGNYSFPLSNEFYITGFRVGNHDSGDADMSSNFTLTHFNNVAYFSTTTPLQYLINIRYQLYGYTVSNNEVQNNDQAIYTYGFLEGSQELTDAQTFVTSYYSNDSIFSAECRIDPRLEPLDVIDVELKNKTIRVVIEEVTINFNGGFTGSIKGRIFEGLRSISLTQVEDYYTVGDDFIKPTVTATYFDGTTRDVTNSATFSGFDNTSVGKQTVTVSYTENGKTVTTSFEITMHPAKPVISGQWFDIDTGTYGFDAKNNNNVACRLEIGYSDNDSNVWESVNITVPANSTYSANAGNIEDENDRHSIGMYFYDYFEQGGLANSLYCHFIATVDGVNYQSQDEYILEEY